MCDPDHLDFAFPALGVASTPRSACRNEVWPLFPLFLWRVFLLETVTALQLLCRASALELQIRVGLHTLPWFKRFLTVGFRLRVQFEAIGPPGSLNFSSRRPWLRMPVHVSIGESLQIIRARCIGMSSSAKPAPLGTHLSLFLVIFPFSSSRAQGLQLVRSAFHSGTSLFLHRSRPLPPLTATETACPRSCSQCVHGSERLCQFSTFTPQVISASHWVVCLPAFVLSNLRSLPRLQRLRNFTCVCALFSSFWGPRLCVASPPFAILPGAFWRSCRGDKEILSQLCHYVVPGRAYVRRAFPPDPQRCGWATLDCFDQGSVLCVR